MCGYVVRQNAGGGSSPPLETFFDSLDHRGPDDRGTWTESSAGVGMSHCRLSIIDLQGGAQPMERDGWSIVYNGELYNYRSLRSNLEHAGYGFRTESDTEVFLQGFRHWGVEALDRARGMFSLAVWDPEQRRIILARDPLGQKPLYYVQENGRFLAGSEIQALLADPDIPRSCDYASLSWYLSLGYVPSPRTAFAKVKAVPPGHYLIVEDAAIRDQVRYWDPVSWTRDQPMLNDEDEIRRRVRTRLEESVRRRLVSDVPLGAFLSGGLDSSILAALAQRERSTPLRTICVGFAEQEYDERSYAREVAEFLGTHHDEYEVDMDLAETLPRLVRHFGQPFADSSAVPTSYVAMKTRQSVKVVLSGDGGDELFGGYRRYRAMQWLHRVRALSPSFLRSPVQAWARGRGLPANRRSRSGEFLRLLQVLDESPVKQYLSMVGLGYDLWKTRLARGPLSRPAQRGGDQWLQRWFRRFSHLKDPAQQAMAVDLMSYLPEDLLTKVDVTTMMHSLECRSPFLDRDVVELALRIPARLKWGGKGGKTILREVFAEDLPESVRSRGKQGFGVPLARWFRQGPEAEYLRDVLLSAHSGFDSIVDRYRRETLLDAHRENKRDAGPLLWALTVLRLWMEEFQVRV